MIINSALQYKSAIYKHYADLFIYAVYWLLTPTDH